MPAVLHQRKPLKLLALLYARRLIIKFESNNPTISFKSLRFI